MEVGGSEGVFFWDKTKFAGLKMTGIVYLIFFVAIVIGFSSGSFGNFIISVVVGIGGLFGFASYMDHQAKIEHEAEADRLESLYRIALEGSDKGYALELAREYYAFKRGGSLTIYDEQAIANDISTMD